MSDVRNYTSELTSNNTNNPASSNIANMSKEQLIAIIQEWKKKHNEISALTKQLKELKQEKKQITEVLMSYMKTKEIDTFNLKDETFVHVEKKQKKSLSKKFLSAQIESFFSDQPDIAFELVNNIFNNLETKIVEDIKYK